jgi:hypothetical protein
MHLEHIREEIERMRLQVHRQRGDIRKPQQAGISTASAEALLERMLDRIDKLCAERDRLKKEQGQSVGWSFMVTEPLKWYDENADKPQG